MKPNHIEKEEMNEDRIERAIEIHAPVSRVWEALTDYRQFGAWFGVTIDGPFKVGELSTGVSSRGDGCADKPWRSAIVGMDEQKKYFAYRWKPYAKDGEPGAANEPQTLVEFQLTSIPNGTRLSVVESGFSKLTPQRYAVAFPAHTGGWEKQLKNVSIHVQHA